MQPEICETGPPVMAVPLRLSIVKYSHSACTLQSDAALRWTHVGKPNMFVVFDHVRFGIASPGICLKIMLEAETLEFVQVEQLCRASSNISPHQTQSGGGYVLQAQPQIQAIVRSPRLAVTYRVEDGTMRRFQVRFGSDADFEAALVVLQDLKCPLSRSSGRPSTAQELVYPTAQGSQPRALSTAAGSDGIFAPPGMPAARQHPPHRPYGSSRFGDSSAPPQSNSPNFCAPWDASGSQHQLNSAPFFQRPSTSPHYAGQFQPVDFQSASSNENTGGENQINWLSSFVDDLHPSPIVSHSRARPLTAPMSSLPESLSQVLPPRRELPFNSGRPTSSLGQPTNRSPLRLLDPNASSNPPSRSLPPGQVPVGPVAAWLREPSSNAEREDVANAKRKHHMVDDSYSSTLNRDFASFGQTINNHAASAPADDGSIDVLRDYAKRPTSERQALIDGLICQYVNDDAFLTLCEDVENSWRRIGFETRMC